MSEQSSMPTSARAPLQRALQHVVIPDLVRRCLPPSPGLQQPRVLSDLDQTRLADASVLSLYAIESELEALLALGWPMDRVYLDAIAGTARLLGQWWISDQLDFATLTVAAGRLQDIVREWEGRFVQSAAALPGADQLEAMLLSEFNDQHSLGLLMLQSFFKRDGWHVHNTWGLSEAGLLQHLQSNTVHLIGLSVCTDRNLFQTRRLIQAIRRRSVNPRIQVMVGGPLVLAHPEMVDDLGADWISSHADHASRDAYERVMAHQSVRRS